MKAAAREVDVALVEDSDEFSRYVRKIVSASGIDICLKKLGWRLAVICAR